MSTATMAPKGAVIDAKAVIVKVRSTATIKLEFLRVLVKKIMATSGKGMSTVVTYAKRAWTKAPAGLTGSLASGLTATREGYSTLTKVVKTGLSWVTGSFMQLNKFVHTAIHHGLNFAALAIGRVHKPTGDVLVKYNKKLTEFRAKVISLTEIAFAGFGAVLKSAYNTETTIRITTLWSTAVSIGLVINTVFGNIATEFVTKAPFIGKFLASALSGGMATVASIAVVASIGALVSFYIHHAEIITAVNNTAVNAWLSKNVAEDTKVDVVPTITTEVIRVDGADTYIEVKGDVTEEQAITIAEAHIEADLEEFSKVVHDATVIVKPQPMRRDYPKGKQSRKR